MSIGVAVVIIGGVVWAVNMRAGGTRLQGPSSTSANTAALGSRLEAPVTQITRASQETPSAATLIISGTGEPNASVELRRGARITAQTIVDDEGVFELPLTVTRSAQSIVYGNIASYDVVTPKAGDSTIINDSALVVARAPNTDRIGVLLCAPGGATQVLRSPFSIGLPETDGLTFLSGDYDNAGGVVFSGRSSQAGRIRIMANRSIIGETGLADDGSWVLIAGSTLPVGNYRLTVQRIDDSGAVNTQMVLPFERRAPLPITSDETGATVPAKAVSAEFSEDHWHISRALHGGGMQHTVIYSALALVP